MRSRTRIARGVVIGPRGWAHRPGLSVILSLLVVAGAAGCAKRPATTAVAAPAPAPAAGEARRAPEPVSPRPAEPRVSGPLAPPIAAAPGVAPPLSRAVAPSEFRALAALKDIHFDFDKYDIRSGDARILDENTRWMKANADHLILIEGHADERGTNEYNLALGERRAKTTMNYLVAQGVSASRMTVISYGEERPQCTEKNEDCWAKNRRAHFLVKPR